jgi:hypothetical protein
MGNDKLLFRKDRQFNGHRKRDKKTSNDLQNNTQNTTYCISLLYNIDIWDIWNRSHSRFQRSGFLLKKHSNSVYNYYLNKHNTMT